MPPKHERFGLDSSCVIALLCDWHVHHAETLSCYQRLLAAPAVPVIPVHVILECFSVLTRIPVPHRVPPDVAKLALEQTFAGTAVLTGLAPETVWKTIEMLSRQGLGGGRVYDAVIAFSVAESGASTLLSWNAKHFTPIAPDTLEVREPASSFLRN